MYRMTILYGMPTDPDHFRRYYHEHHIPLARQMSGLTGWNLCWMDEDSTQDPPYILIAELYTESREAMQQLLQSPAGEAARADLDNFVTGTVAFLSGYQEEVALQ